MGNHFRKPDEGQDAPRQTEPQAASHFAYSTSYEGQSEGQTGSRFAAGADANEDALFGAVPARNPRPMPSRTASLNQPLTRLPTSRRTTTSQPPLLRMRLRACRRLWTHLRRKAI